MKPVISLAAAVALLGQATALSAATVVESTGPRGHASIMKIEGQAIRMEMPGRPGGYLLMLLDQDKRYSVNEKQKMAMDVSKPPEMPTPPNRPAQPERKQVQAELKEIGKGPDIAGYPTVHYQVLADGHACTDEYISPKALELPDLKNFAEKQPARPKPPMPFMPQDPCTQAGFRLLDEVKTKGMVMRSVSQGKVVHEVTAIQTGVKVDPAQFTLPEGYQVMTPQDMMRQMMQRQGGQGMPGGERPGGMPPTSPPPGMPSPPPGAMPPSPQ